MTYYFVDRLNFDRKLTNMYIRPRYERPKGPFVPWAIRSTTLSHEEHIPMQGYQHDGPGKRTTELHDVDMSSDSSTTRSPSPYFFEEESSTQGHEYDGADITTPEEHDIGVTSDSSTTRSPSPHSSEEESSTQGSEYDGSDITTPEEHDVGMTSDSSATRSPLPHFNEPNYHSDNSDLDRILGLSPSANYRGLSSNADREESERLEAYAIPAKPSSKRTLEEHFDNVSLNSSFFLGKPWSPALNPNKNSANYRWEDLIAYSPFKQLPRLKTDLPKNSSAERTQSFHPDKESIDRLWEKALARLFANRPYNPDARKIQSSRYDGQILGKRKAEEISTGPGETKATELISAWNCLVQIKKNRLLPEAWEDYRTRLGDLYKGAKYEDVMDQSS